MHIGCHSGLDITPIQEASELILPRIAFLITGLGGAHSTRKIYKARVKAEGRVTLWEPEQFLSVAAQIAHTAVYTTALQFGSWHMDSNRIGRLFPAKASARDQFVHVVGKFW